MNTAAAKAQHRPPAAAKAGESSGAQAPAGQAATGLEQRFAEALQSGWMPWSTHYRHATDTQRRQLAHACAALAALLEHLAEHEGAPVTGIFTAAAALIEAHDVAYLPRHWRRLKEKAEAVASGKPIHEVIALPRAGNANARKYDDPEVTAWAQKMRSMPQNYPNAHIIRRVRLLCDQCGKATPSESWFNALLAAHDSKYLTAPGRWGSRGRHGAEYRGYVPVATALFAGDCWQMDATRVNLIEHKNRGEGKGKDFLFIVAIRDVHSGDVLGCAFDTKEDRWAYTAALTQAVREAGYLPYELVTDRFPGHNTPEWKLIEERLLLRGVKKITRGHKATSKARLERWFETLQSVFMQDSAAYYGEGIQSMRPNAHRSAEYLAARRKEAHAAGWDFDAACAESARIVAAYRATPLNTYSRKHKALDQSPAQLHQASERPHATAIQPWDFALLFGLEKKLRLTNQGLLKTDIARVTYTFRVDDYAIVKKYREVVVAYDLDDLTQAYVFESGADAANRPFLCIAPELKAAQVYGPEADWRTLQEAKKRVADLDARRRQDLAEIDQAASELEVLLQGIGIGHEEADANESRWLNAVPFRNDKDDDYDDQGDLVTVPVNVRRQY